VKDSQKQFVYKAEQSVSFVQNSIAFSSYTDIQDFSDKITNSRWFRNRWDIPPIKIKKIHGNYNFAYYSGSVIYLPKWALHKWVICHELAHAVQPPYTEFHGCGFCRDYLELVYYVFNRPARAELKKAFLENGVTI